MYLSNLEKFLITFLEVLSIVLGVLLANSYNLRKNLKLMQRKYTFMEESFNFLLNLLLHDGINVDTYMSIVNKQLKKGGDLHE